MYVTDKSIQSANSKLKQKFVEVSRWLTINGLTLSPNKSVVCSFSRSRAPLPNVLGIGDLNIPYKSAVKYLGVYLDRKLLWKDHINYLIKRTETGLNIIRAFSHQKWGADPNTCLMFYKAYIRSILDYASILYGTAAETHFKKIDTIKNECLRNSIGLLKSTRINVLEPKVQNRP